MNDKNIKDIIDSRLGIICVSTELKEKILNSDLVPKKKSMLTPVMVAACLCVMLAVTVLVATFPKYNTLLSKLGSIIQKQINSTNNITDGNNTKEGTIIIAGQIYSTNEPHLDLSSKGLTDTDITPLKSMTNLIELNLSGNMISDITPLESLNKLIYLDLSSNKITDLTPLKLMTNLRYLNLNNNQLNDITVVGYLTNLINLYLSNNQIKDIKSLESSLNLSDLDLSSNEITDITPLKLLINLLSLAIHQNQISELSPLKLLTNLNSLDISYYQISDLTVLRSLTNLQELTLHENLTDAQIQELENALPNCKISISSISTSNSIEDIPDITNTLQKYTAAATDTFNGHTYSIYNDSMTWYEAKNYCESIGGHLVTITSSQEQEVIGSLIYKALYKDQEFIGMGQYYMGATNESGSWEWITGEPFEYTNWYTAGVPNIYPDEHYSIIYNSYGWDTTYDKNVVANSSYDYSNTGFICEWDGSSNTPSRTQNYTAAATGTFNGHTYSVYDISLTWYEAKIYCEQLGGHLVTITSSAEQSFIESLISKGKKDHYYMGGTDEVLEGDWKWITGEDFSYTNWQAEAPNNMLGGENYLQIYRTWLPYKWNDIKNKDDFGGVCDYRYSGFICEWE